MKVEDDGSLVLHEHDLLPRYRDRRDSPIELRAKHFTREARVAAFYAAGAGQRYGVKFVGHGRDVEVYKGEWTLEVASIDLDEDEPIPQGGTSTETLGAVFNHLDAVGMDLSHPFHRATADMIRRKMDGLTDRDLVELLDAGVDRVAAALGFAPGGANFDVMVSSIEQLRARQLAPIQISKGLLDALVLTPWGPPPARTLLTGKQPTITHVEVTIQGLPGFRATVDAAAFRELQVALEALLGPVSR